MKNVFKIFSILMISGILFTGCGSSNSSNNASCSTNGVSGSMQNGTCVASNLSSQCSNSSYPYYISSVSGPSGQTPACCSTPTVTYQTVCQQVSNTNCGQYGSGWYWNGTQCVP